jgi:signal transduction histidine kinase/CheY-like chemotaxis protein
VVGDFEEELVFQDGRNLHLVAYGAPLHDAQGKVRGAVGAFIDITARKQAEAERQEVERGLLHTQKLESLGVLAGGIAHDFNNLLTGVLGNASLARSALAPDSAPRRHVERIEVAATRAADLCRQMLAYAGKGRFMLRKIDLSRLVEDTLHLLRLSISKKAELKLDLTHGLPAIEADPTQISQVVMNLVMNASEAIGEHAGRIHISTRVLQVGRSGLAGAVLTPDLPVGEYICLEVSDTGGGMPPETVARIFEPFFTTKFTGRGLGLAAVLGIVRGHKGALQVASEPGRGSNFTVLFPRAEGNPDPPTRDQTSDTAWRAQGKVLVIDDEEGVRSVITGALKLTGLEPVLACDGREGLERFRAAPGSYDVVLLDLTMPELDGFQVFHEIRNLRPDARVILMSGYDAPNAGDAIKTQGLAGYIQKPFNIETLQHVLRSVLEPTALGSRGFAN